MTCGSISGLFDPLIYLTIIIANTTPSWLQEIAYSTCEISMIPARFALVFQNGFGYSRSFTFHTVGALSRVRQRFQAHSPNPRVQARTQRHDYLKGPLALRMLSSRDRRAAQAHPRAAADVNVERASLIGVRPRLSVCIRCP